MEKVMKSGGIVVLFLMVSSLALKVHGKCPDTWTAFDKSCYKFVAEPTTWYDAWVICIIAGSHMVRIDSQAEDQFVTRLARSHGASVWIGLNDLLQEGRFMWDNRKEPTYTNWRPLQPDNYQGRDNCVYLWFEQGSLWGDALCEAKFPTICEINNL